MAKAGKSPIFAIVVVAILLLVLVGLYQTQTTPKQFVGTLVNNFPTGDQVVFNLPQAKENLAGLQQQLSSNPYYQYFANNPSQPSGVGQAQNSTSKPVLPNSVALQQASPNPQNPQTSSAFVYVNNKSSYAQNPSTNLSTQVIQSNIPTVMLGDTQGIKISGKITLVDPITKARVPAPYYFVMQIRCISEFCNNDNLPTPKGNTGTDGSFYYPFIPSVEFNTAGNYVAKVFVESLTKDVTGRSVQIEADFPFIVLPAQVK